MPESKGGIKGRGLFFHTNFDAEFKKIKINDGSVIIDDKEFFVSDMKAINLKTSTGVKPLYLFRWDSLLPAGFFKKKETIEYAQTGDDKTDRRNYHKFYKKLKSHGHKGKGIESNKFIYEGLSIVNPKFLKTKLSPSLLRETGDMRFLKNMKKYAGGEKGKPSFLGYFLAFAGGIGWIMLLVYLGVIRF